MMRGLEVDSPIRKVALIGAGSVGRGWAALLLARGYRVVVHDPHSDEAAITGFVERAWPDLVRLAMAPSSGFDPRNLSFVTELDAAVQEADLVFENAPEDEQLKAKLIARIDAALPSDVMILSSSGGIRPTLLQRHCKHPERVVVAHPFNPPHLIPLVEIVGGEATAPWAMEAARRFIAGLGKRPIVLKREMVGHLTNRLQAALLREAFHCLVEDVASAQDIDDALRFGLGPRWALMGGVMTFNLAGGPRGASHTLELAADAYEDWWADLGQVSLTPEVRATILAAAREVSGEKPLEDWIVWRDEALVDVINLQNKWITRE